MGPSLTRFLSAIIAVLRLLHWHSTGMLYIWCPFAVLHVGTRSDVTQKAHPVAMTARMPAVPASQSLVRLRP